MCIVCSEERECPCCFDSAVSNARVSVANTDTGVRRIAETSTAGSYYITDLIPGTYSVTVERAGFKSSVQKNVVVQAAAHSTANAVLTVGDARETVEVIAPEISIETEQPLLGTTIQQKLLEDLPQLSVGTIRQIDAFTCLAPGVAVVKMTDGLSSPGVSSIGRINGGLTPGVSTDGRIDGGLDFQNEVIVNGVPIAFAEFQGRQYFINPPFDLVREFTVLQGAFSAQYGLGQGVAQYQFQSRTNNIHGNSFAIYRDAFFDAPGAVNDVNPNDRGIIGEPNTDHEIDSGFTAGGPLRIPKLYDGHDKTFWFASIEQFRQASGQPVLTVPSGRMVKGDFSGLVVPGETTQIPIFVPIAWQDNPSLMPAGCVPGALPGQQFPGNVIPQNCFSTVSKSLLGFVPRPTSSDEVNNFQPGFIPILAHTVWGLTIDHNINPRQAIHGAYWRNQEQIAGGFVDNPLNNTTTNNWFGSGLLVTYSHAVTPRMMVTAGMSWTSEIFNYHQQKPIGSFAGAEPSPSGQVFLPGINFVGGPWQPVNWGTLGWQYSINRKHGLGIAKCWRSLRMVPMKMFSQHDPLTDAELERLGKFLEGCKGGEAMNLEELDGFFAALIAGPETVMPSEYYPEVFGGEMSDACEFRSIDQANEILGLITRHWNDIAGTLFKGDAHVPLLLEDEDGRAHGNDWARGFMRGMGMRHDGWAELVNDEEHGGCLIPMMMLCHEHDEDPEMRPKPITPEKREEIIGYMAAGLLQAYRYFREHRQVEVSAHRSEARPTALKVGRNEMCPCGSGKKYKKCCGGARVN